MSNEQPKNPNDNNAAFRPTTIGEKTFFGQDWVDITRNGDEDAAWEYLKQASIALDASGATPALKRQVEAQEALLKALLRDPSTLADYDSIITEADQESDRHEAALYRLDAVLAALDIGQISRGAVLFKEAQKLIEGDNPIEDKKLIEYLDYVQEELATNSGAAFSMEFIDE